MARKTIDIHSEMTAKTASGESKKRFTGLTNIKPMLPEENSEEFEKIQAENEILKTKVSKLIKRADSFSDSLKQSQKEKEQLKSTIDNLQEKYGDIYIPTGYKNMLIPCDKTIPYKKQQEVFGNISSSSKDKDKFSTMIESIETSGLLQPIAVREIKNRQNDNDIRYEIIIGHSRVEAYKFLSQQNIPGYKEKYSHIEAMVYTEDNLSDERADDLFYESNFAQRGTLPVKAMAKCIAHFAKKTKRDQANQEKPWYRTFEEKYKISKSSVFQWLSAAKLIDSFIDLIANRKLNFINAIKLSKLSQQDQYMLYNNHKDLITNKVLKQLKIQDNYNYDQVVSDIISIYDKLYSDNNSKDNKANQLHQNQEVLYTAKLSFTSKQDYDAFIEWHNAHKSIMLEESL